MLQSPQSFFNYPKVVQRTSLVRAFQTDLKRPQLRAELLVLRTFVQLHLPMASLSSSTPTTVRRSSFHVGSTYPQPRWQLLTSRLGLDGLLDEDERYFKQHGEPLFSSHMIDLSEEPLDWNIETTAKYLRRAASMNQWLEMVRIHGKT